MLAERILHSTFPARFIKPQSTCVQLLGRNDYDCKGVIMT